MKKLMAVLILVLVVMLSAAAKSEAACTATGKIVYAVTGGAVYTVYVAQNSALPTYYYFFTTQDPEIISTLNAAQAANLRVSVNGNASVCGSSGITRAGGVIVTLYAYSLW